MVVRGSLARPRAVRLGAAGLAPRWPRADRGLAPRAPACRARRRVRPVTIARLAGLDLVAVAAAYLVAVAFRVGGRVEIAEPEQAIALAALAAAVQVGG